MPRDTRYLEFVKEQLAPLGGITSRGMFGGWCLYCDGVVFALIADGAMFLKADKVSAPMFEERGLQPFKPFPDQDMVMSYREAPPDIFEDPAAMRQWCGAALEAAHRSREKGRRGPRKRK
ncbi:MAG: TfoX/Sxy family protein [Bryobacteraceae bacterium]